MKIISITKVDESIYNNDAYIKHSLFSKEEDFHFVYEVSGGDISVIKAWMDKIWIKYDTVYFINERVMYTINGVELTLSDLGSGERMLLYLLACKAAKKELIIGSLFERMGGKYEYFVYDEFKDEDFLTVIIFNYIIPREYKYLLTDEI